MKMGYNERLNAIGITSGCIGGVSKYFLQIHNTPFMMNLLGAAFTALICGVCGVAGKELYVFVKKKVLKK